MWTVVFLDFNRLTALTFGRETIAGLLDADKDTLRFLLLFSILESNDRTLSRSRRPNPSTRNLSGCH